MRKPARPWTSNARCQARNSSSDSWYQRQASSRVTSPLRTAATTAALRRTTHLLVAGSGRPSMGDIRIGSSPESGSTGRWGEAEGPASLSRGPSVVDPSRQTASFPLLSLRSTGSIPATTQFTPVSRIFNDFERICHQFFLKYRQNPAEEPAPRASAVRVESISEPKRVCWRARHCAVLTLFQQECSGRTGSIHATVMPKVGSFIQGTLISRINHDEKKKNSRSVLASSENFAFVIGGNFAQR